MGWAWRDGLLHLIGQNFTFWSTAYRPMGQLYYWSLFRIWGLNPLPYRVAILAFVIVNAYLSWRLALLLSNSHVVAFLTGLLVAGHPRMVDLYYQNDIIYDVLAYFFSILTLIYYVSIRKRGNLPTPRQAALIVCLFVSALNSKEISVPLAGFILAYEWLFPARTAGAESDGKWWTRGNWLPLILVVLDAIYAAGKIFGPHSLTQVEAYTLHISLSKYLENNLHFWHTLLYPLSSTGTATFFVVDAALLSMLAFFKRSAVVPWCCVYILISTLPLSFIRQREGTALYLPLFGWALLAAIVFCKTIQMIVPRLEWARLPMSAKAVRFAVVVVAAVGLGQMTLRKSTRLGEAYIREQEPTWTAMSTLKAFPFRPKPGSSVLFIHDPFNDWRMAFIAELVWNDHSVVIQLAHMMPKAPTPAEMARYDTLLTFKDGHPELVSPARSSEESKEE